MEWLTAHWDPIVLSAVIVFVASFLAWMVLPHHRRDWAKAPNEDGLLKNLGSLGIGPGQYMFPMCGGKEDMRSAEFQATWQRGPWGILWVFGRRPSFARNLVLVFLFYLVVGIFVAYMMHAALQGRADHDYGDRFRIAGVAAVMAYVFGAIPHAIFYGKTLRSSLNDVADGIAYGLLTAGTFAWLW